VRHFSLRKEWRAFAFSVDVKRTNPRYTSPLSGHLPRTAFEYRETTTVKVFLSWSGVASKAIADGLRYWLPNVIQSVSPWMSAEDIARGSRWNADLTHQLETTRVGIICVTPENMGAPWLLFEAGALSKTTESTFVCPYLFNLEPTELTGPLAEFQASSADRDGTKRLLQTINSAAGNGATLSERQLEDTFDVWWPKLESTLARVGSRHAAEPRQTRTERDMLKEVLDLLRGITRRQSTVDVQGAGPMLTAEVLRSLEGAKSLLRLDKGVDISPETIAVELAERLPDVLRKPAVTRKRAQGIRGRN